MDPHTRPAKLQFFTAMTQHRLTRPNLTIAIKSLAFPRFDCAHAHSELKEYLRIVQRCCHTCHGCRLPVSHSCLNMLNPATHMPTQHAHMDKSYLLYAHTRTRLFARNDAVRLAVAPLLLACNQRHKCTVMSCTDSNKETHMCKPTQQQATHLRSNFRR